MTTLTISKSAKLRIWIRIWKALRAFDEALHHDPTDALNRRIERLESRLDDRATDARSGAAIAR